MFDCTFVDTAPPARRPFVIVTSLFLQTLTISIAILLPLVYTETLPSAHLKSFLAGPPLPAATTSKPQAASRIRTISARTFSLAKLVDPAMIPRRANGGEAPPAPPDIGMAGVTPSADGVDNPFMAMRSSVLALPEPAAVAQPKQAVGALHVGGVVAEANLIQRVQPIYPPLARAARVQGTVEFIAVIGRDGRIENLQVVHGSPLLVAAARDAISKWRYRPTLLNGQPVEVLTTITVNFLLKP
jgi:periplasmic protein TonB